ncbi:MAG: hypothetical protein QOD29_4085, partial [Alphaproteobacteria bacterium]|nr:hypothetical protein [Alphaproteobacteria bacterium]
KQLKLAPMGSSPRMTPERVTQSNRKMLLMPAYSRHHAAEQTHRSDVLILHRWRALDPSPCLRGHRRAISLTTIFDEHYPTLCNMASRADERMVLDTTYTTVWSGTTFVRINSAPQAIQRITRTRNRTQKRPPGHEEYRSFAPGC